MFEQFSIALALECIFMKHGRQIVYNAIIEDCIVERMTAVVLDDGRFFEGGVR